MFTGIVEETGQVVSLKETDEAWKLTLRAGAVLDGLAIGDSLAVNGCCLTVVGLEDGTVSFDLLEESIRLTSFRVLQDRAAEKGTAEGMLVNLERSLAAGGRLGGHFVSGHVDALGTIRQLEQQGKNIYLRVEPGHSFMPYMAYKGSVSIDGISLTVADVQEETFGIWLIPHTMAVTNLQQRRVGDPVNVEVDILAKYVESILRGRRDELGDLFPGLIPSS